MPNCKHCKKLLTQKRFSSGVLESPSMLDRRQYCGQKCMALAMEGVVKVLTAKNSRRQSAKTVLPQCEMCQAVGKLHVHHKDENPMNNAASNLMTLCPSCHRRCHSPNFTETGEQRKDCEFCSGPSVKRGLCFTHLSRYKRFGHALAKKKKTASGWVLMLHDGENWLPFPLNLEQKTAPGV